MAIPRNSFHHKGLALAKKKGKQLYYYVVESPRVDGKPRIVHQTYLGTAERVAALVKGRTSPGPLSTASREFGLPGALWLAIRHRRYGSGDLCRRDGDAGGCHSSGRLSARAVMLPSFF